MNGKRYGSRTRRGRHWVPAIIQALRPCLAGEGARHPALRSERRRKGAGTEPLVRTLPPLPSPRPCYLASADV